jgi:hypothetical protein
MDEDEFRANELDLDFDGDRVDYGYDSRNSFMSGGLFHTSSIEIDPHETAFGSTSSFGRDP